MKKGFALLVALMMLLGTASAFAEKDPVLPVFDVPSSWADPDHDRATTIDIVYAQSINSDYDRELVMEIYWADSAWTEWVYMLFLTPDDDEGKQYTYQKGTAVCYTYDEDGMQTDEQWLNEALNGTLTATQNTTDGTYVLSLESHNDVLQSLTLYQEYMPCPSPEELVTSVIQPILNHEENTAGSELKLAELASNLIRVALAGRFYATEPGELGLAIRQALEDMDMTEEEYAVFLENKSTVSDFIQVITGLSTNATEDELLAAREICANAGVIDAIDEALTSSLSAGVSVEQLLTILETIENEEAD